MPGGDLDVGTSGVLDAAGSCTLSMSPDTPRTRWKITNIAVSGDGDDDLVAVAYLLGRRIGGTYSGTNDNIPVGAVLTPGQRVTVTWSGGTAGNAVRLDLYGSFDVARGGGVR